MDGTRRIVQALLGVQITLAAIALGQAPEGAAG
jgi:hypothetical protein